jgi:hypothetical protein
VLMATTNVHCSRILSKDGILFEDYIGIDRFCSSLLCLLKRVFVGNQFAPRLFHFNLNLIIAIRPSYLIARDEKMNRVDVIHSISMPPPDSKKRKRALDLPDINSSDLEPTPSKKPPKTHKKNKINSPWSNR